MAVDCFSRPYGVYTSYITLILLVIQPYAAIGEQSKNLRGGGTGVNFQSIARFSGLETHAEGRAFESQHGCGNPLVAICRIEGGIDQEVIRLANGGKMSPDPLQFAPE